MTNLHDYQNFLHHKLIIIGAGASGLMAAVTARDLGIDTAILEGNDRIGKKISMTGDGRCNITNDSTIAGTDGSGYVLAQNMGHVPAIVQLKGMQKNPQTLFHKCLWIFVLGTGVLLLRKSKPIRKTLALFDMTYALSPAF